MKRRTRKELRRRRRWRVRKKTYGTAAVPRMAVMVSNRHMYVQFIDDDAGRTLCSASSLGTGEAHRQNVTSARELGRRAGEAAVKAGIKRVVFDRGGFKFHGRVKAILDGAIEAGIRVREEEAPAQPASEEVAS